MRTAFTIAAKDLRQRVRDRSAFVIAFFVPFGLAAIFSLTLANVSGESKFTATYAVVDLDHGQVAQAFTDVLSKLDFVKLQQASTIAQASKLADDGKVDAAFVIPSGFSATAAAGQGGELRVITNPNSSIGSLVARSLAQSFASDIDAIQVSVATVLGQHSGPPDPALTQQLVMRARETPPTAALNPNTAESKLFSSTTFYAAGMAVFFVFFTVEFGVRSLLAEREGGTLARLLVAPMRPAWIIAGKSIASFVVGLVSMIALVLASALLLGADWGSPVGVGLLVVAGVLAAMGLTALVSSMAKTPGQAGSYASVAAVVGGMLGGTFFPVSQGPSLLANLSLITPQAWMMRGFQELAGGAGAAEILPSVAACLIFAALMGGIAVARAGRLVPR
jgi:ABC-2 type transport system permease protein